MGSISKNFSYSEFEKSDIAKRYGIINIVNTFEVRDNIKALVDNVLQPLREAWGAPLFISSGYRSPELNSHPSVGGVPTSQHCKGEAADIGCSDPYALAKLVKKMKLYYDQMILYPTFLHISHKANGKNRMQILYSSKYKGKKL